MDDLSSMLKADLIALCEDRGLDTDGTKAQLIARLEEASEASSEAEEVVEAPEVEEAAEEAPAPAPAAADDNESFVKQAYLDKLGREADLSGLNHYVGELDRGTLSRAALLETLEKSAEGQARSRSL